MGHPFGILKPKLDQYFLDEKMPYEKAKFKTKNIITAAGVILGLFILYILVSGEGPKTQAQNPPTLPNLTHLDSQSAESKEDLQKRPPVAGQFPGLGDGGIGHGNSRVGAHARTRSANQVIRRGGNGGDPDSQLPMGFGVSVKLVNAVHSTTSGSPVVALVSDDVVSHGGSVSIPAGTQVIGEASFDDSSKRIQIRFHTFVYPEGDQHSVQALALMGDGSAGVEGDYHSGNGTRQAGRFVGTFAGGLADGMIQRESGGPFGTPVETGSLRNGLLNGAALSAKDQTQLFSESLSNTKPSMDLPAGTSFLLYLEKEYSP